MHQNHMENAHEPHVHPHDHPHDHAHDEPPMMPNAFQGPPKTMFFLGLFVGLASCMTLALGFIVWSVMSGKSLIPTTTQIAQAAAPAPTPSVAQPSELAQPSGPVKPVDEAKDHIRGPKNAKITLIEYSDFECPFCKQHFATMNQIADAYPKDVRIVYRDYPLSFHQNAMKEAEAANCVAEVAGNDAFWRYHDKIFSETTSNGTGFSLDRIVPAAKEVGVDTAKLQKCLDSGKYVAVVNQSLQEGLAAGVQGTPATFVNGKLVSGAVSFAQLKGMIDALLKS